MSVKEVFKRMPGLQEAKEGEGIPIIAPEFGETIEYDRKAGAIYIRFSRFSDDEKVERTEEVTKNCNFDLDKYGSVIGIEILNAKKWIEQYLNRMFQKSGK